MSHRAGRAGVDPWCTLPAMRHKIITIALSLLLTTACSSVVVIDDSTSGGGAVGEASEGSSEGSSTGLGGSETGEPGSTGAAEDSSGSTSSTGGEATTTTGEGSGTGSTCLIVEADDGPTCVCDGVVSDPALCELPCNEAPALVEFYWNDIPRCEACGVAVDPALCGCSFTKNGCECDGALHEEMTCGWPCQPAPAPEICTCGNFPADVEFCEL